MDNQGNLYGTTMLGGANGFGTVFEIAWGSNTITTRGSFDVSLNNGDPETQFPPISGGLAVDSDGDIFGTAALGASGGAVFEIAAGSSVLVQKAITGGRPSGGLVMDSSGDLFGTTQFGGTSRGGFVYELPAGGSSISVLASFDSSHTRGPLSAVAIGAQGILYGAQSEGTFYSPNGGIIEIGPIPFSNSITGSAAVDNITLIQDPDHHNIDWALNGGQPFLLPINDPAGLTINGNGGNDVITLDYSNGNPLPATLHLNGTFTINGLVGSNTLAGRTLEIGGSTVYLTYANHQSDPLALIRGYLQDGFNGGSWDGTPGALTGVINSDVAANDPFQSTGIGYLDLAHWRPDGRHGKPLSAIELKATLYGDTNLDGSVDLRDLLALAQNYGATRGETWESGDFNYDGRVDLLDLNLLLRNFTINGHRPGRPLLV